VVGVEGDQETLWGFGKDWHYEVSYVWGRTTLDGETNGLVSLQNLYESLRVVETAPGSGVYQCQSEIARASGCIPVNPFDGYSTEEQAYLRINGGVRSRSDFENTLAFISGSVAELPAGPLQISLGLEKRTVTAYEDYSTDINLGVAAGNQISDSERTTFDTDEVFTEVNIPILRDMAFAKELTFEGAYRWSDASIGGKYETYKYGAQWEPVEGLRFRAMKNRAVRSPVLAEVTGLSQTAGVVDDPCINYGLSSNSVLQANCAALGIPANYDPPLAVKQNVQGFVGGNPDLKPEEADTFTYGFVVQAGRFDFVPEVLSNLTISVDRFEIEMTGLINTLGRQNIAELCYGLPTGQREVFCSQVTRGADPSVPGANYVLTDVDDQYQNIAALDISGVDLEINYGVELGRLYAGLDNWGSLSINSIWTFYDKASQVPAPGLDPIDLLGAAGGSTSDQGWLETQGNTNINWTVGRFRTSWTARFVGEAKSAPADLYGEEAVVTIGSRWYHDMSVRFAVNDQVEVYGGINNVFDKDPPFFPSSQSGTQALDTIPAYYDVFGRQAFVGARLRF
jgi:outer membrane receptor protein involved in Fe transport